MNTRRRKCADCSSFMWYGGYVKNNGCKGTGWQCLHCGTVTESFGTLDVTRVAS